MKWCTAMCLAALAFGADCSTMMAQTLTTIASFNGTNGDLPYSGLISDPNGNLYGTTFYGGDYGYGTVFEFSAATHAVTAIASFNAANGANPVDYGRLVVDANGNLYGTTSGGGANHAGTVFEIVAGTHAITTLATFDKTTSGYLPYASLSADTSGNLYGAAQFGGPGGGGTIFKVNIATKSLTILAPLTQFDTVNGYAPSSPPILAPDGNLYGTTAGGGPDGGNGTIYKIEMASHAFSTVATFNRDNGSDPANMIVGPNGKLYGVTIEGGSAGTIFSFDASTHAITNLASFDGSNGAGPYADLISDASGNLFGATYGGGNAFLGTIFEFNAATGTITALASFDGSNGANPTAGVFTDAAGNLYGTTTGGFGGKYGLGTIYELSVPEPSSLCMMAAVAIGALVGTRRRR